MKHDDDSAVLAAANLVDGRPALPPLLHEHDTAVAHISRTSGRALSIVRAVLLRHGVAAELLYGQAKLDARVLTACRFDHQLRPTVPVERVARRLGCTIQSVEGGLARSGIAPLTEAEMTRLRKRKHRPA